VIHLGDPLGDLGSGLLECDIALHARGPDAALARLECAPEPGVVGAVRRSHVEAVAVADAPDRDERPEAAVRPE
jgi:hypothetical protein